MFIKYTLQRTYILLLCKKEHEFILAVMNRRFEKMNNTKMNSKKKKYRIKSKLRFTIFMTLVLTMMIVTSTTVMGINTANSLTKPNYTEIQVQYGDTLWDLALEFGSKNIDPRNMVSKICQINHITAQSLQPGQKLLIPTDF